MAEKKKNQRFSDICSADTVCLYFSHCPQQPWLELHLRGDTRALSDTGLFPARPELTAFRAVLQSDFLLSALNSLKIGLIVTCLCIILAVLAGYALSRYKSRMLGGFQIGLLVLQMFPLMLMLMPLL